MERVPAGEDDGADAWLLRGGDLGCARLLRLLRDEVAHLAPGSVVHLETSDPVAPIDLPAWCRITGHDYLGPVPDDGTPRYGVRVVAGARATQPASPWRLTDQPVPTVPPEE
ncbi:sulfurtransferase TusA family protein [Nocardioides marinquilinus]|uniref:sulfurtransferase TusA family protein n=1 Tax=Nocardioides marinquilinus TaxID=1210400 RepID=UPI0031EA0F24